MEEEYWNRFLQSGRVTDYMNYKGLHMCRQVMERYKAGDYESGSRINGNWTGGKNGESDYGNGDGASGVTYR